MTNALPGSMAQSLDTLLPSAFELLHRLGITPNYIGFHFAAYAAALAAADQSCLLLVTKRLYPSVALRFGTTWRAVERDLRTVVAITWNRNPDLLSSLAQESLKGKPPCARFIAILAHNLPPQVVSNAHPS